MDLGATPPPVRLPDRPSVQPVERAAGLGAWWRHVELVDTPSLAKSGSTHAPNNLACWRHFRPSRMTISLIRLRRIAIPC